MVKHWDQEKTRSIAEKNSSNRKENKCDHTTGTKSYARSRAQYLKEHGHEPDPIRFFYKKHTRNDGQKSFIDKVSEEAYGKMQDKLDELVAAEGDGHGAIHEMRERAYVAVIGLEKRYSVRGYGLGVIPEIVSFIKTDDTSSYRRSQKRAYAALQSKFVEIESKYQKQQEDSNVQHEKTQAQLIQAQQELTVIKQLLMSQQQQFPFPMPPSQAPQMYWRPHSYPANGFTACLLGSGDETLWKRLFSVELHHY